MRVDIIGPDIDGPSIMRDRFVELTLIFQGQPEVIFRHPAFWVLCEGSLIKGNEIMILRALMKGQCAKDQ